MINSEVEFFDAMYAAYLANEKECSVSCHELGKARRRVRGVIRTFNISSLERAKVLDIGCGLGYYSEAIRLQGAEVTAVDTSSVAIEFIKEEFPKVDSRVASFPEELRDDGPYDIIWSCDFSFINTFDVDHICQEFIQPSLKLLKHHGSLIIGWHSDFSGTMGNSNWAHWPLDMIEVMKNKTGLSGPRVATMPTSTLSWAVIHCARMLKKSIPIYLHRRA
ncbi:MAG: class I SAM-dependent methyltransferase [bacterium]